MRISEGQKVKFNKEFEANCESITTRLTFTDLHGEDVIALTKSQHDRLMKAYEAMKGMIIKMSKTQLTYNMKMEGGLIPMLAGLIPFLTGTVLPSLGLEHYRNWPARVFKSELEMVCILRREVVCVRLKLMARGHTVDVQAVKDLKLQEMIFT